MQLFLEFLVRSSLLLLIAGCIVGLLLRISGCQSPTWNRFAWAFVLLLGVFCVRLPLEIPVLTPTQSAAQQMPEPMPQEISQKFLEPVPMVVTENIEADRPVVIPVAQTPVTQVAAAPLNVSQPVAVVEPHIPQRTWAGFFNVYTIPLLFAGWLVGMVLFFTAQLFFWFQAVHQVNGTAIPGEIFREQWKKLLASYGLDSRKIELRIAESVGPGLLRLPMKSVIVVPATLWEEATDSMRLGILKHELSHYRHHDLLKSFILRMIALLHWFNPMAHYAVRKFDEAAEWRCDAEAFGANEDAEGDFAETMLLFRDTTPIAAVYRTAFCGNNVRLRAERLVNYTLHRGDSPMKKILIVFCCVLLLSFGLFEIKLTARQTAEGNQQPVEGTVAFGESWKTIPPEMKVIVKNETEEPVKDVELHLNTGYGIAVLNYYKKTDENGIAVFDLSELVGKEMDCFRLWIKPKEKYVAQFMNRDRLEGRRSVVPSEYNVVVKKGITFGGVVVDEDGNPIQDARIGPYYQVKYSLGDEKTDIGGKWGTDKVNPNISEYDFQIQHPDYIDLNVKIKQGSPEMEQLKNQTARFVLKRGINVAGTVVDTDGKPIADAKVELGHRQRMFYQQGKEYYQETKTDSDGNYAFPATPMGSKILIVTASGKAPQIRQLTIQENLEPQDFQLKPGNTIRFKVVDSEGNPIAGASVNPYSWQSSEHYLMYHDSLRTDDQGTVEWNDAPEGVVGYHIYTYEKEMISERETYSLEPREEPYTITLHPQPVFVGRVIDKETKQSVKEFTVVPGAKFDENYDRVIWQRGWARQSENGEYRCSISSHTYALAIRIEADGYLPSESETFVSVYGDKVVDFELTPAAPINGVVLHPDGKPVENAEVRMIDSQNGRIDIFDNELKPQFGESYDYLHTKSDGKFSFRSRKEGFVIVVAHKDGCAIAFKEEVEKGTITLKPWARVEATLVRGSKPWKNQSVSLFGGSYSCSGWDWDKPVPFFKTYGMSNGNGNVVFEKLYPGIEYWLDVREHKSSSTNSFLNVLLLGRAQFIPQPGETSNIQVGGVGSPVLGKVSLSDEYQKKIQWDYAKITLSSIDPSVPRPDYGNLPVPAEVDRNNRIAVVQWYWKWIRETEEGKAFYRNVNAYNMQCDEENGFCPVVLGTSIDAPIASDGTFRVDDVPPGTYKVSFYSFQPKASSEIQPEDHSNRVTATRDTFENTWLEPVITVPPIPSVQSDQPFDAGTIRIELMNR